MIEMGTEGRARKCFRPSTLSYVQKTSDFLKVTQISLCFLKFHSCSILAFSKLKICSSDKLTLTHNHHTLTMSPMLSKFPFQKILSPSPSLSIPPFLSVLITPLSLPIFYFPSHTPLHPLTPATLSYTVPIENCSLLSDLLTVHLLCTKHW